MFFYENQMQWIEAERYFFCVSIGMALQMSHFYSKKVLAVKHVPDVMNSVLWIFICQVPKQLKQSVDVQL